MKKLLFAIATMALMVACSKTGTSNEPQNPTEDPQPSEDYTGLTDVKKRIVVIEEYTGVGCVNCPDGHRMVNEIVAKYKGKVYSVNIHAGKYADSYKTTEGTAYLAEAGVNGYPAGCISRHLFADYTQKGGMAMSRGRFETATKLLLKENSPVNIKATAEIEKATSTLTVRVKGYYTADPTDADGNVVSSNSLYVMLLQDSVLGYQNGGSTYNPDQMVGNQYCHMHMLRATINGTWGETITPAKNDGFVKEYTYTIPATIGTDKIATVLEHMRVLVFVAADHTEIYTADEPTVVLK